MGDFAHEARIEQMQKTKWSMTQRHRRCQNRSGFDKSIYVRITVRLPHYRDLAPPSQTKPTWDIGQHYGDTLICYKRMQGHNALWQPCILL